MTKPVSEQDFFLYWSQLTAPQKNALYNIARIFAESNPEDAVEQERWQLLMEAREDYLNGGKTYSWEEVKAMRKDRKNGNDITA